MPVTHMEYEYSQKLLNGVKKFSRDTGTDFFVFSSREPGARGFAFSYQEWAVSKFFNKENVEGLVFPTAALTRYVTETEIVDIAKKIDGSVPMVSLVTEIPGIPSIIIESEKAFKAMIEHLIVEHDRKNFLFMGIVSKSPDIVNRYQWFCEVLSEHGLTLAENHLLYGMYTSSSARKLMVENFPAKDFVDFDAVVCVTDDMALGVISHMKELGISVPDQVCVCGFDNTVRSEYSFPSLSTINQFVPEQSYEGARILVDRIRGLKTDPVAVIHSECYFRGSCGCIPYDSKYIAKNEFDEYIERGKDFYDFAYSSFFVHNDQNLRILEFTEDLQSDLSLDALSLRLEKYLLNFDIGQSAICLYKRPVPVEEGQDYNLPDSARIFFAHDRESLFTIVNRKEYFDCSKKLLPGNMLDDYKGVNVVRVLYHGKYQYGYMIMSLGCYEVEEYMLIYSMIAKFIANAYEVSCSEEIKSDLTEKNQSLSKLSKTDELTGILNRRGFMLAAQQELSLAAELGKTGLVIYGDIDGLKKINDTYGHDAGDRAILAEVELLRKTFRAADTIGRLGGDEFAILSISLSMTHFLVIKKRLEDLCDEWNKNTSEEFRISISLGAAVFNNENCILSDLLKAADEEQYKEKKSKKAARN